MAKKSNTNTNNISKTSCFQARLEHVDKPMKKVNGTCLVAVDIGYSTVKYFSGFSRGAFQRWYSCNGRTICVSDL